MLPRAWKTPNPHCGPIPSAANVCCMFWTMVLLWCHGIRKIKLCKTQPHQANIPTDSWGPSGHIRYLLSWTCNGPSSSPQTTGAMTAHLMMFAAPNLLAGWPRSTTAGWNAPVEPKGNSVKDSPIWGTSKSRKIQENKKPDCWLTRFKMVHSIQDPKWSSPLSMLGCSFTCHAV